MAQQEETGALKLWAPVAGLTLSAFIFNTSEFIPIGLLSDIARDFQIDYHSLRLDCDGFISTFDAFSLKS